jgi:hypothetical protein
LIKGHAPCAEEWGSAVGGEIGRVRFRPIGEPRRSILLYGPRWSPQALVGSRRSWPPDSIRVAWDEIALLEAGRQRSARNGIAAGAAIGAGVAIAAGLVACAGEEGGQEPNFCGLVTPFVAIFTIPVGVVVGGGIASGVQWTPIYCKSSP